MTRYNSWLRLGSLLLLAPSFCLGMGDISLEILYQDLGPYRHMIPGNCTNWHEVYPQFCGGYHQSNFIDNGDNVVSTGDQVELSVQEAVVLVVTITNVLPICHSDLDSLILEPLEWPDGSPVCQEWLELVPDYGVMHHVIGWDDNGDNEVGVCDYIVLDNGTTIHVQGWEVGTDGVVTTPAAEDSWSRMKRLFMFPF